MFVFKNPRVYFESFRKFTKKKGIIRLFGYSVAQLATESIRRDLFALSASRAIMGCSRYDMLILSAIIRVNNNAIRRTLRCIIAFKPVTVNKWDFVNFLASKKMFIA